MFFVSLWGLAAAQEPAVLEAPLPENPASDEVEPEANPPEAGSPPALAALAAELELSDALIAALTRLQGGAVPDAERAAAVAEVGALGDARALPFLRREVSRSEALTLVAIAAAIQAWPEADEAHLIVRALIAPEQSRAVRQAGLRAILALGPDLLTRDLLERMVFAPKEDADLRALARETLAARYPDYVIGSELVPEADRRTQVAFGVSTAVVGGSTLAFVGTLGRSDLGVGVGVIGGGIAGAAAGSLYARRQSMTREDALRGVLSVGWGSTFALVGASDIQRRMWMKLGPPDYCCVNPEQVRSLYAGGLALGSGAGLVVSELQGPAPTAHKQLQVQLGGGLGSVVGVSTADLLHQHTSLSPANGLSTAFGAGAGLVVGRLTRDLWTLDGASSRQGSLLAAQTVWASALLPVAFDASPQGSVVALSGVAGAVGGLTWATVRPASNKRMAGSLLGWGAGNALGAGIAMFTDPWQSPGPPVLSGSVLAVGTLGAVAGHAVAERVHLDPGDVAFSIGSTAWLSGNALALGSVVGAKTNFGHTGALTLTTVGAAIPGGVALASRIEPKPGDVLMCTAGGAWGLWYGALVPIAVVGDGRPEDLLLAMTLTSDALVLGTLAAASVPNGIEPSRTVVPQIVAVTGAATGALSAALATSNGRVIAGAAVAGSTVGFVAGGLLEAKGVLDHAPRQRSARRLEVPGSWMPSVAPQIGQDGEIGVQLGLTGVGW